MSGDVTYACRCLNIKIYLANKYYLEGHEKYRRSKFVRLEDPPISGWQFELSMKGVDVEYPSLIRIRHVTNNSAGWITISCHNCTSDDVYSVKRPNAKATYPVDTSLISQIGDQVIIHKETIFGQAIDKLQKKGMYSNAFHIVLNSDLPIRHVLLDKELDESFGTELLAQQKHVQQLLKQALINMEEITEKRIQVYQQEQEIMLIQDKKKAIYDGTILWQRMREISKSIHEEVERVKRLSSRSKERTELDILVNRTLHDEKHDNIVRDTGVDSVKEELSERESYVHFSHGNNTIGQQQRRRSSVFRRDLFGGLAVPSSSHNINSGRRRSSYALDESAIANSLKRQHHSHYHDILPSLLRRSCLVPPNQYLHPLAPAQSNDNVDTAETNNLAVPPIIASNNSSSWEDEEDDTNAVESENVSSDDDSEDLFALDEDIVEHNHDLLDGFEGTSGRRASTKYIDDLFDEVDDEDEQDFRDKQQARQQQREASFNFATSVPFAISHPTPPALLSVRNEIGNIKDSSNKNIMHPSSSFIEPTYLKAQQARKPSFFGYDYAEADRRASSQLPPLDFSSSKRRSSIPSFTGDSKISSNNTIFSHHHSSSSNKNKIHHHHKSSVLTEEDEEVQGLMIPPHILAANTITDETEALFGSVPRNNIRNRPIE